MVERELAPVVYQVYVMSILYLAATQMWLDTPGRPCQGAVFVDDLQAHRYATERNLRDLLAVRALVERWGFAVFEFPASFDYFYVRSRLASVDERAVLFWEGV